MGTVKKKSNKYLFDFIVTQPKNYPNKATKRKKNIEHL